MVLYAGADSSVSSVLLAARANVMLITEHTLGAAYLALARVLLRGDGGALLLPGCMQARAGLLKGGVDIFRVGVGTWR